MAAHRKGNWVAGGQGRKENLQCGLLYAFGILLHVNLLTIQNLNLETAFVYKINVLPGPAGSPTQTGLARAPPHLGLDVGSQQRVDEPHVVVQACFTEGLGGSVWEDTRPRDGKAIVGHAQVLQGGHVLGNLVITVAGHVSIVIVLNIQWCVRKHVPNTESFAICSPCTFNLKKTTRGLVKSCSQALASSFLPAGKCWAGPESAPSPLGACRGLPPIPAPQWLPVPAVWPSRHCHTASRSCALAGGLPTRLRGLGVVSFIFVSHCGRNSVWCMVSAP